MAAKRKLLRAKRADINIFIEYPPKGRSVTVAAIGDKNFTYDRPITTVHKNIIAQYTPKVKISTVDQASASWYITPIPPRNIFISTTNITEDLCERKSSPQSAHRQIHQK